MKQEALGGPLQARLIAIDIHSKSAADIARERAIGAVLDLTNYVDRAITGKFNLPQSFLGQVTNLSYTLSREKITRQSCRVSKNHNDRWRELVASSSLSTIPGIEVGWEDNHAEVTINRQWVDSHGLRRGSFRLEVGKHMRARAFERLQKGSQLITDIYIPGDGGVYAAIPKWLVTTTVESNGRTHMVSVYPFKKPNGDFEYEIEKRKAGIATEKSGIQIMPLHTNPSEILFTQIGTLQESARFAFR